MSYEVYRVLRRFQWGGAEYAPQGCTLDCRGICWATNGAAPGADGAQGSCAGKAGSSCGCGATACRCQCGIRGAQYAGDVWPVRAGDPRKAAILSQRFAVYDAALQPAHELLKLDKFKRLVQSAA